MRRSDPPAHTSEVKAYLRCRLQWFWTAPPPRGLGLVPKNPRTPLWFGSLLHEALQVGYDAGVPFAEAYRDIFPREFAKVEERAPWLKDNFPLGEAMLEGYQDWSTAKDQGVHYLALETKWHGVTVARKRLGGIFDAVVKRPDGLWILDFKTTSSTDTSWTRQDLQATIYTYAAREIFGPEVRGVIFRFLLKKAPATYEDLILKSGKVTQRNGIPRQTTLRKYLTALAVATMQELVQNDFIFAGQVGITYGAPLKAYRDKLDGTEQEQEWYPTFKEHYTNVCRAYYEELQSLGGESPYFWDVEEPRTPEQIRLNMKHVVVPAIKEMTSRRRGRWIGPTGLGSQFAVCRNCSFRDPCRMVMEGADYKSILEEEYELRDIYRGS